MMLHPPPPLEGEPPAAEGMDLCTMMNNDGQAIANLMASSMPPGGSGMTCTAEELTAICLGTFQDPPCGEALDRVSASMPQEEGTPPMDIKSMTCMIALSN